MDINSRNTVTKGNQVLQYPAKSYSLQMVEERVVGASIFVVTLVEIFTDMGLFKKQIRFFTFDIFTFTCELENSISVTSQ
ncbi:hypothetical protein T02_10658 [Trichinella nativa]|uniref:Uncharacterized protein n=1 Tax=Trichinella nativa TaxID=6335 RepID=A0A0V1L9N8_9BILA|nr:hypothetical protein T02_10658 [Trichinella nativa]